MSLVGICIHCRVTLDAIAMNEVDAVKMTYQVRYLVLTLFLMKVPMTLTVCKEPTGTTHASKYGVSPFQNRNQWWPVWKQSFGFRTGIHKAMDDITMTPYTFMYS